VTIGHGVETKAMIFEPQQSHDFLSSCCPQDRAQSSRTRGQFSRTQFLLRLWLMLTYRSGVVERVGGSRLFAGVRVGVCLSVSTCY